LPSTPTAATPLLTATDWPPPVQHHLGGAIENSVVRSIQPSAEQRLHRATTPAATAAMSPAAATIPTGLTNCRSRVRRPNSGVMTTSLLASVESSIPTALVPSRRARPHANRLRPPRTPRLWRPHQRLAGTRTAAWGPTGLHSCRWRCIPQLPPFTSPAKQQTITRP
jgi:hypothetical protein